MNNKRQFEKVEDEINTEQPQQQRDKEQNNYDNNKKIKSNTINNFDQLKDAGDDDDLDFEVDTKLINKLDKKGRKYEFVGDGYSDEELEVDENDIDNNNQDSGSDNSSEYEYEDDGEDLDDEDHLDNINEIKKLQQTSKTIKESTTTTSTTTTTTTNTNTSVTTDNTNSEILKILEQEEEEDQEEEENIELVARSFMYKHIQEKKIQGVNPLEFTKEIGFKLELEKDDDAWEIITAFLTRKKIAVNLFLNFLKYNSLSRPYRKKLESLDLNSFEKVVQLFENCKNIVIITGAGVSVSCGIADFRSKGGIYETIEKKYNLPRPEALFDIRYLCMDPKPFFEFAKEIFPGSHVPSPTHHFIKLLDDKCKLLRNYTQNIDTLEHVVGINSEKLVNCHGSFSTATCIKCKQTVPGQSIREPIMKMEIPYCVQCKDGVSFMKPDIVFFGETLPDRFDQCVVKDIKDIDLLIVMGSSLQVQPVALLPDIIDKMVPQILINRELVAQPHEFDYHYMGDCDSFVKELLNKINW